MTPPRIAFLSVLDLNLAIFRRPVIEHMRGAGWEVFAVTPEGGHTGRFAEMGAVHVPYRLDRRGTNPLRELPVIARLARIFSRLRPTILHTFTAKPNIYGTFAGRLAGVPVIVSSVTGLGSFFIEEGGEKGAASPMRHAISALYRGSAALASRLVFQNRDDLGFFLSRGIVSPEKAVLIRGSGVNTQRFDPARFPPERRKELRRALGFAEGDVVVTLISRLIRDKGVSEFLAAAAMLAARGSPARFLLVGDYDDGNPRVMPRGVVEEAAARGIVTFPGWRNDIPEILAASDIVALPSYREGVPVSLQEALGMGLPVVTTNAPGCRECVIEGENGHLVPVRDAAALADAVGHLASDAPLRARMGAASRAKCLREFDAKIIVSRHVALYHEELERRGLRPPL